jgi:hypothetical protein
VSEASGTERRPPSPRAFWAFWIVLALAAAALFVGVGTAGAKALTVVVGVAWFTEGVVLVGDINGAATRTVEWLRAAEQPSMLSTLSAAIWRFWGLVFVVCGVALAVAAR